MKQFIGILAILICVCSSLFAQDVEQLPDDPRVKKGTLANGLFPLPDWPLEGKLHANVCILIRLTGHGSNWPPHMNTIKVKHQLKFMQSI